MTARKSNKNRCFTGGGILISSQLYWIPKEQCFAVRKNRSELTHNETTPDKYFKKIPIGNIIQIKSKLDYLLFHEKNGTISKALGGLTTVSKCLLDTAFVRTYRSCIINTEHMILKKDAVFVTGENQKQFRVRTGTRFVTHQQLVARFGLPKEDHAFVVDIEKSHIRAMDRNTYVFETIPFKDIAFIRLIKDYVVIWCWSNKVVEFRTPMRTIADKLASQKFLVTDNYRHLANMQYASEIYDQKLILEKPGFGTHYLPVTPKRKKAFVANWIAIES